MSNQSLANDKAKELMTLIHTTPLNEKEVISWDELNALRVKILQGKKSWQNAVRIAILNFVQKWCSDEDPALPKEVITFLEE